MSRSWRTASPAAVQPENAGNVRLRSVLQASKHAGSGHVTGTIGAEAQETELPAATVVARNLTAAFAIRQHEVNKFLLQLIARACNEIDETLC